MYVSRRDFYLSAEESVEYGIIDHVIYPGRKDPLSVSRDNIALCVYIIYIYLAIQAANHYQ